MTLEERDQRWEASRASVKREVEGWMERIYWAQPNAAFAKHVEERGRPKEKGKGGKGNGVGFQQSLDETVQWQQVGGRWDLILPWQVVKKLLDLERLDLVQVAKPSYRKRDGTMSVPEHHEMAKRLQQAASDLEARIAAGKQPMGFHKCAVQHVRALAARYMDMPLGGVKVHKPNAGSRHSFYYDTEALPHDETKADKEWQLAEAGNPKANANQLQNWRERQRLANALHDAELAWVCEMVLMGNPVRLSNFYMEPLHLLRRADGTNLRLARIHVATRPEPFGPVEMDGTAQSGANKFKEFIRTHASGAFHGGDQVVHHIWEMMDHAWDAKEVFQITNYGYHQPVAGELGGKVPPSGAWFSPAACCDHLGRWHRPDANGAFLIPVPGSRFKRRYQLAEVDAEGNAFKIPPPTWAAEPAWLMEPGRPDHAEVRARVVRLRADFTEFCSRLVRAVGGMDAMMGLGVTLAYGAGPEFFAKHACFPGLWAHGEMGQGKSTLATILAKIWGLGDKKLSLELGSGPGLEAALTQLGSLPLLLEEFQASIKEGLSKALKAAFNRDKIAKQVKGGGRTPLTTPVVVGQATSIDPATRSRYLHIAVSETRRQGTKAEQAENIQWLKSESVWFVEFGRFILSNRRVFAERLLAHHAAWMADPMVTLATKDSRAQVTHGVAIAGMRAMWDILGEAQELPEMYEWMAEELSRAAGETKSQVEVQQFLQKMATAIERGHFEQSGDLRRVFSARKVAELPCPPPDARGMVKPTPAQRRSESSPATWDSWELRINPSALFDSMREYARQQNMVLPLSQSDVQSQLSAWPAWVDTRKGGGTKRSRQRFDGYSNARDYWALRLDQLPGFGYRAMSDVEYRTWSSGQQFKLESGRVVRGVWATEEEELGHPDAVDHVEEHLLWVEGGEELWFTASGKVDVRSLDGFTQKGDIDPRKGPFYRVIEALNRRESGEP